MTLRWDVSNPHVRREDSEGRVFSSRRLVRLWRPIGSASCSVRRRDDLHRWRHHLSAPGGSDRFHLVETGCDVTLEAAVPALRVVQEATEVRRNGSVFSFRWSEVEGMRGGARRRWPPCDAPAPLRAAGVDRAVMEPYASAGSVATSRSRHSPPPRSQWPRKLSRTREDPPPARTPAAMGDHGLASSRLSRS